MVDFKLFFLTFKDIFNKYTQTMGRGSKAIMACVEDMMLWSPAASFGEVTLPKAADTSPNPLAGDHSIMSSTQGMIP